ncbi:cellulose synthase-like protein E6 isoform X2 [Gossypium australe]|uniref:Cellulose synthase-like protein E6 isoform X2 n=1 Tax=Gossypium australe TaxID=47621 RepID=A0A5B6WX04_9ROSI|nr:cellulose synthase-like protein E6 isoform X2 [Gossypium australe]
MKNQLSTQFESKEWREGEEERMGKNGYLPLFETRPARGLVFFRSYAASIFIGICFICFHRVSYFPETERWVWVGMFVVELWFSFYFFITVIVKWNPVFRSTFKDRLSSRFEEEELPGVDIFVCTADPRLEPPTMVVSTVLSVMAYDYPPHKLSVYLSDDGCSDLTFYALLEASRFAQLWLPFCRKLKVEPTSPEAYFQTTPEPVDDVFMANEWLIIRKSYEDMKSRIESITSLGKVPAHRRNEHKGFDEWDFVLSRHHHPSILQILIDGRDPNAIDIEGKALPTLVYLAREKRPQIHHNFKAGALNALIRVSSRISNAAFILNVDCDMYSNNSKAIKDALCFFLDEGNGHEIAYVQYPQAFDNLTENEIYGSLRVLMKLELAGFDGNGGPCYVGTGCVHRRESLSGMKYSEELAVELKAMKYDKKIIGSASFNEEDCKALASCTYEENTPWGKEKGVKYGSLVEDVLTGMSIQSKGWRSVFFNPQREAFLGMVPTTLLDTLVQHKRWGEGELQIFLSKHCPFVYGRPNMPLKLQLSYCIYNLWAPNCFATLYYVFVPSFCLFRGISLFPKISSSWGIPYLYVIFVHRVHSLVEYVWLGGTVRGWLNEQRMWMFKRTTSYFFATIDHILKIFGFSKSAFAITGKVADDDVHRRYEQEIMEFGTRSPMFTVLATLALFNLLGLIAVLTNNVAIDDARMKIFDIFSFQILLCYVLVFINLPIYQGMFFRKDSGKIPVSVTLQSVAFALLASTLAIY